MGAITPLTYSPIRGLEATWRMWLMLDLTGERVFIDR